MHVKQFSTLLVFSTLITGILSVQVDQQLCTDTCGFMMSVDKIGEWPTDTCQTQTTYEICKVTIIVTHRSTTASIDFQPYNDSADPSDKLPNDVKGTLSTRSTYSYWIPTVEPTISVTYRCRTNENMCDKKYITNHWSTIIKDFKPETNYPILSTLLYVPQSTPGRCFSDEQQVNDCRGYCQYSYYDDSLGPTYSCLSTAGPTTPVTTTYVRNRVQVGSNDTDHDTLSVLCNKEKCNGPSTVDQVKKLFDFKEPTKSTASTQTSAFFLLFLSAFFSNISLKQ